MEAFLVGFVTERNWKVWIVLGSRIVTEWESRV